MSPLFVAHDQGFFAKAGIESELVWTPNPGDAQTMLSAGELQVVHGPFTNAYRAADQGADVKIIAGSGKHGLCTIAQPETHIHSVEDLVSQKDTGLKVGTQRLNTLELAWYGLISDAGLGYDDFDMKFFFDHFTMSAAFENKELDLITHVEPYATMLSDKHHGVRVADSVEIWGEGSPDCVVSVRGDFLNKYPLTLKRYIRAILKADAFIKEDMARAVGILDAGSYYKVDKETLTAALPRQPPGVDLRAGVSGMNKAIEDMVELGYMKAVPQDIIDLSLLEEVIEGAK